MIRIDDLVRQRLSGAEEPERAGAWLNMRELLDKEMPQAAGPNWRRIIGYLSLLLFLGAGTVGGYKWYQNGIGMAGGAASETGDLAASFPKNTPATTPAAHLSSATNGTAGTSLSAAQNPNKNLPQSPQKDKSKTSEHNSVQGLNASRQAHLPLAIAGNKSLAMATASKGIAPRSNFQKNPGTKPSSVFASSENQNAHSNSSVSDPLPASHQEHSGTLTRPHKNQQTGASQSDDVAQLQSQYPNRKAINIPKLTQPQMAHIRHDSVQRLELVSRRVFDGVGKRYVERVDTFPLGKFARNIMLPLMPEEKGASSARSQPTSSPEVAAMATRKNRSQKQTVAVKSTLPASKSEGARNELDLASKQVSSTTNSVVIPSANAADATKFSSLKSSSRHFNFFDFERLAAVMDQVKSNLQRIELYPGVMAGINASMFTPNALGGVQAGITSLFILNDYWSLMTELKYFQRYNTGSSLRDDYKQVRNGTVEFVQYNGVDYKRYQWEEGNIRHSFNYDVIRTFELPVMMRRNWGRAYAQGGVNFVLSSAIATDEISDSLNDFVHHSEDRPATHDTEPFIPNDHPLVLRSDFGSRFGIGYVLSAGFMFSPNIYVDGRITQSVWDNSKTDGARRVAQDLLRTPSIQISVGYKFGPKQH
ncbi:MAG: outer membrane beta-barrel protein [Bacteroidetes bacterium]|nr:outer membrane beta-barrel protein [Bacteroidota bacterium]